MLPLATFGKWMFSANLCMNVVFNQSYWCSIFSISVSSVDQQLHSSDRKCCIRSVAVTQTPWESICNPGGTRQRSIRLLVGFVQLCDKGLWELIYTSPLCSECLFLIVSQLCSKNKPNAQRCPPWPAGLLLLAQLLSSFCLLCLQYVIKE